jgi:plasmid stabilization system protein ParE
MKLRWLRRAYNELLNHADEIALVSPRAAIEVTDRLLAAAEALRDGRATGRPVGAGIRELRIAGTRLSLFYRINQETERIEALHVAQAEEPWPEEGEARRRPSAA